MLGSLVSKLNNRLLPFVILLALAVVCGIPIPSLMTYFAADKELDASQERFSRLTRKNEELKDKECVLSENLHAVDRFIEGKFGGLDSALLLRNIILQVALASNIETKSCLFRDAKKLIEGEELSGGFRKTAFGVKIEMKGSAFLEDFLLFIYTIENLDIGIRLGGFSVVEARGGEGTFSFSLNLKGFYFENDRAVKTNNGKRE